MYPRAQARGRWPGSLPSEKSSSLRRVTDTATITAIQIGLFIGCPPHGRSVARFAWLPQKPGAEIIESLFPFIGIALSGFALLAGLVLRYMRHTAATIEAGENRLRYLALHDALCGLPNRASFTERLETVIADVRRGGQAAAVFCIDLDHFKDVNDTLGHPVGDELLKLVAARLIEAVPASDFIARIGGDEFAVLVEREADGPFCEAIGRRIVAATSGSRWRARPSSGKASAAEAAMRWRRRMLKLPSVECDGNPSRPPRSWAPETPRSSRCRLRARCPMPWCRQRAGANRAHSGC